MPFIGPVEFYNLIMTCSTTGKVFRIAVNRTTWEDSSGGTVVCPMCGRSHQITRQCARYYFHTGCREPPPAWFALEHECEPPS